MEGFLSYTCSAKNLVVAAIILVHVPVVVIKMHDMLPIYHHVHVRRYCWTC